MSDKIITNANISVRALIAIVVALVIIIAINNYVWTMFDLYAAAARKDLMLFRTNATRVHVYRKLPHCAWALLRLDCSSAEIGHIAFRQGGKIIEKVDICANLPSPTSSCSIQPRIHLQGGETYEIIATFSGVPKGTLTCYYDYAFSAKDEERDSMAAK